MKKNKTIHYLIFDLHTDSYTITVNLSANLLIITSANHLILFAAQNVSSGL